MKISIVIVTYNRLPELKNLLKNINQQSLYPDEIIIWDDGSVDGTKEFLSGVPKFKNLVYHYSQNKGIGYARFSATNLATGDVLVVQDSDDIFMDGALEHIKKKFTTSNLEVLVGNVVFLNDDLTVIKDIVYPPIKSNEAFKKKVFMTPITPFKHSGVSFRKTVIEKYGSYDPTLKIKVDVDLILKWITKGAAIGNLNYTVSGFRVHGFNISKKRFFGLKIWFAIIKKYEKNIFRRMQYFGVRFALETVKFLVEQLQMYTRKVKNLLGSND